MLSGHVTSVQLHDFKESFGKLDYWKPLKRLALLWCPIVYSMDMWLRDIDASISCWMEYYYTSLLPISRSWLSARCYAHKLVFSLESGDYGLHSFKLMGWEGHGYCERHRRSHFCTKLSMLGGDMYIFVNVDDGTCISVANHSNLRVTEEETSEFIYACIWSV